MLYLFHGSNTAKSADKARGLVESLRTKKPDAAFVEISADNWSRSAVEENVGGQGLFSSKYIVFLDRVTDDSVAKEELIGLVPMMSESPNIFVVVEGKLNAEYKKVFDKHCEKSVEHEIVGDRAGFARKDFNIFALADAMGARDTMRAWSIYRQAIDAGLEPESIAGTLFWQVKSMMVASTAKSAGEAGLAPFVYTKAKKASANYSREELEKLSSDLVTIYHDGHRGVRDLELGLECVLLSISKRP